MKNQLQIPGALVHQPRSFAHAPCLNEDVVVWCNANCREWKFEPNLTSDIMFSIWFEHEVDVLHFMMRWF